MSTQPVPIFPEDYQYLVDKPVDEIINVLLNDSTVMSNYRKDWQTEFAKSAILGYDENDIIEGNPIVDDIWKIALNQSNFEYAGKLFYICGFLLDN